MEYQNFTYLRGRTLPSFESEETEDPRAMIFVVNDDKNITLTDTEVIEAVIHSMLHVLASDDAQPAVSQWLDGRIRKLVKRARNKQWDDLDNVEIFYAETTVGSAKVKAFAPIPVSQTPAEVRKLQLTGLKTTPSEDTTKTDAGLHVTVNSELSMSVSKSAAQAAHAVQLFIMNNHEDEVKSWVESGCIVNVAFNTITDDSSAGVVHVYDAGLTEIPAGSLTATAVFN